MHELGFNAPSPLIAAEKRQNRFVVDSLSCYRFEAGKPAGPKDASRVMAELLKLHAQGYLRTDAKALNFLITDDAVTFIDFRLRKPALFPELLKNIERARLTRVYPESLIHLKEEIRSSTSFKIASWLERKKSILRRFKKRVKGSFKSK